MSGPPARSYLEPGVRRGGLGQAGGAPSPKTCLRTGRGPLPLPLVSRLQRPPPAPTQTDRLEKTVLGATVQAEVAGALLPGCRPLPS